MCIRDRINRAAQQFGAQCVVVAIDARRTGNNWEIFTHGGREPTGIDAVSFAADVVGRGAGEILLTSMDCDGVKTGYDLELTRAVANVANVPVIASGGAGSAFHLIDAVTEGGASAVLAASIFHFGEITISQAREEMMKAGLPMRKIYA